MADRSGRRRALHRAGPGDSTGPKPAADDHRRRRTPRTTTAAPAHPRPRSLRTPLAWGAVLGVVQPASPLAFPWLDTVTVHALGLTLIAAVYLGFAVADGRRHVLAVELAVASAFVVLAAAAVTGSLRLIVAEPAAPGLKDLWQHRTRFVSGTRWCPPFCAAVDVTAAALLAVAIAAGLPLAA